MLLVFLISGQGSVCTEMNESWVATKAMKNNFEALLTAEHHNNSFHLPSYFHLQFGDWFDDVHYKSQNDHRTGWPTNARSWGAFETSKSGFRDELEEVIHCCTVQCVEPSSATHLYIKENMISISIALWKRKQIERSFICFAWGITPWDVRLDDICVVKTTGHPSRADYKGDKALLQVISRLSLTEQTDMLLTTWERT